MKQHTVNLKYKFLLYLWHQNLHWFVLHQVLTKSRIKLESSGYLPGADLPQDEALRDGKCVNNNF